MEFPLYNQEAEKAGTINLSDDVFGLPMNRDLLYQVTTSQMANQRQTVAHAKGRSEVRGGGKKPWRQKGTGRARHGSIRSPIWKGGGVTHGPTKEKIFKKSINRKMVQKALKIALSSKARENRLVIVDSIASEKGKTKEVAGVMKKFTPVFGKLSSILLVMPDGSQNLYKASRNLPYIDTIESKNLNPLSILSSTYILLPKAAVEEIEKHWGSKK